MFELLFKHLNPGESLLLDGRRSGDETLAEEVVHLLGLERAHRWLEQFA